MSLIFIKEDGNNVTLATHTLITFMIDKEDLPLIEKYDWHANGSKNGPRIMATIDGKSVYLHRLLMGVSDPKVYVDHWNGDVLDFRKGNLRVTDARGNARNRVSNNPYGVNGIYRSGHNSYNASITVNYESINLGTFATVEEAIYARVMAEIKYFGKYAPCRRYKVLNNILLVNGHTLAYEVEQKLGALE